MDGQRNAGYLCNNSLRCVDKSDVRYVFHTGLAASIEAYQQESGRASRDDNLATCVLYYKATDKNSLLHLIRNDQNIYQQSKEIKYQILTKMAHYYENNIDCRRKLLMNYFNKSYVQCPANVSTKCDNCTHKKKSNT